MPMITKTFLGSQRQHCYPRRRNVERFLQYVACGVSASDALFEKVPFMKTHAAGFELSRMAAVIRDASLQNARTEQLSSLEVLIFVLESLVKGQTHRYKKLAMLEVRTLSRVLSLCLRSSSSPASPPPKTRKETPDSDVLIPTMDTC